MYKGAIQPAPPVQEVLMLRIIRWTTNQTLGPQETLKAIEAAQAAAKNIYFVGT